MKTRLLIIIFFLISSLFTLLFVYLGNVSQITAGILANLGTGFIGTALTVLVVDWLYERRSLDEQCRNIALSILLEFDHVIWVWQGGSRSFNVNQMYTLLKNSEKSDLLPYFTQNLFMRLGSKCATHLNLNGKDISRQKDLFDALEKLSSLEIIRDGNFKFLETKELLISAVPLLASACKIETPKIITLPITAHRTTSEEHQHYRHFGRQIDGTQQPLEYT